MRPTNTNAPSPFWDELFKIHRERHYTPEPPMLYDFQIAFDLLRKRSGMTLEQLAARLSCLPSILAAHEARNGVSIRPDMFVRLKRLALDFDLPKMAKWFETQELRSSRRKWRRGSEQIGLPDRDYET